MSRKPLTSDTPTAAEPVAAPSRLRGRRISRAAVSLAVVLVVLGGLAVTGVVLMARGGASYLVLTKPVAFGDAISEDDLTTVTLPSDSALDAIPASEKDKVIGRFAAYPLAAKSVLTRAQVASGPIPGPGKQVVSVTLKSDQAPAAKLESGIPVMLVRKPDTGSSADQAAPLSPVAGKVRTVRELEYGGGVVVDVIVSASDGPAMAAAAADSKVALLVTAGS